MTLVEPERFENVFGRVMGLLGQDELQDVLLNDPTAPFSAGDQDRLADLVQDGFWRWKRFHEKYGEQQNSIRRQDPGKARWSDAKRFLQDHAGAVVCGGHKVAKFRREGDIVRHVAEDADVLAIGDKYYVCADYAESLVYDTDGSLTPKLGLHLPVVCGALAESGVPGPGFGRRVPAVAK
jgi:hypothetical protein